MATSTTSVAAINAEVDRRVQQRLIPLLLAAAVGQHSRHGFKTGCECSFCNLKRRYAWHVSKPWNNQPFQEFVRAARELKRV